MRKVISWILFPLRLYGDVADIISLWNAKDWALTVGLPLAMAAISAAGVYTQQYPWYIVLPFTIGMLLVGLWAIMVIIAAVRVRQAKARYQEGASETQPNTTAGYLSSTVFRATRGGSISYKDGDITGDIERLRLGHADEAGSIEFSGTSVSGGASIPRIEARFSDAELQHRCGQFSKGIREFLTMHRGDAELINKYKSRFEIDVVEIALILGRQGRLPPPERRQFENPVNQFGIEHIAQRLGILERNLEAFKPS